MLAAFASLVLSDVWPNMGIHDGDNKVVWTVGCCDGDLITVDFRDEVGDGNGGNGPPQPENLFFAKGQKQLGFRYQFYPREELEDQLIEPPQDVKIDGIPLTVWDNSDADALPPW